MKKRMKSTFFAAATLCAALTIFSSPAKAETTQCTAITTIPITITTQGIYCLNGNLSGNLATGSAVTIATNNVTVDLNGYKLGNLAAGLGTNATGIFADQKKNITIRNGTIRGFKYGILLEDASPYTTSSGHLIEEVRLDMNTFVGIYVVGPANTIRNNQVVKTGGTTQHPTASGISTIGAGVRIINNDVIEVVAKSAPAYGIFIGLGGGAVVQGNRISDVYRPGLSYGITISNSSLNVTVSRQQGCRSG